MADPVSLALSILDTALYGAPRQVSIPYTITPRAIALVLNGKHKSIPAGHANFDALAAALRFDGPKDVSLIEELADMATFIARRTFGEVQISDGEVRFRGAKVMGAAVDRIQEHMRLGYDLAPLANFLARLMTNPTESARDELFLWLESGNCPITPDGFFLAFKKVRMDYKDFYTGTMDNSVGQVVQMPRYAVDADRSVECSVGLHFCSHGYLPHYQNNGNFRIMIVQVDPADVVAIPVRYENQKGRAWRYTVIGETEQDKTATLYEGKGIVEPVAPLENEDEATDPNDDVVKFPVGSYVVAIEDSSSFLTTGASYLVHDCDSDCVYVNNDDGDDEWFGLECFRAATGDEIAEYEADTAEDTAFEVGNYVVAGAYVATWLTSGNVYKIEDISDAEEIHLKDDDGDMNWHYASNFRLATVDEVMEAGLAETPAAAVEVVMQTAPKPERQFHSKSAGKTLLESELRSLLQEHGQRGTARLTGIPRTTLQEWIALLDD